MKKSLSLFLILFAFSLANAQNYRVIHVNGNIKNETTNEFLQSGDEINVNDHIVFENEEANAALISRTEGVLSLQVVKKNGEFVLADNVLNNISSQEVRLSSGASPTNVNTFSAKPLTSLEEIQQHFGRENYLILDNLTNVEVEAKDFPVSNSSYFMIKYDYGQIAVNKPVDYEMNSIILDFNKIFELNDEIISEVMAFNFELYYRKGKKDIPLKICDFDPIFVENDEILPKIQIIADAVNIENEEFTQDVFNYLTSYYGAVYIPNLKRWLNENFRN